MSRNPNLYFDSADNKWHDLGAVTSPNGGVGSGATIPSPPPSPIPQQAAPQTFDMNQVVQAISNTANDISNLPDKQSLRQLQESQLGPDQVFAKQNALAKYIDQASMGKQQTQMMEQALGVFDPHTEMDWIGQANKLHEQLTGQGNMFLPQAVGNDSNSKFSSNYKGNPDSSTPQGRDQMRAQSYALGLLDHQHAMIQNQRAGEDFLLGDGFMDYVENIRREFGDNEAEGYFELGNILLKGLLSGVAITPDEMMATLNGRQAFMDKYNPMQWDPISGRNERESGLDYGGIYNLRTQAHIGLLAQRQVEDQAFAQHAALMGLGFEGMPELAKFSPKLAQNYALSSLASIGTGKGDAPFDIFGNEQSKKEDKNSKAIENPLAGLTPDQALGHQELQAITNMGNQQFDLINKNDVAQLADKVKLENNLVGELTKGQSAKDLIAQQLGVTPGLHPDSLDTNTDTASQSTDDNQEGGDNG